MPLVSQREKKNRLNRGHDLKFYPISVNLSDTVQISTPISALEYDFQGSILSTKHLQKKKYDANLIYRSTPAAATPKKRSNRLENFFTCPNFPRQNKFLKRKKKVSSGTFRHSIYHCKLTQFKKGEEKNIFDRSNLL